MKPPSKINFVDENISIDPKQGEKEACHGYCHLVT